MGDRLTFNHGAAVAAWLRPPVAAAAPKVRPPASSTPPTPPAPPGSASSAPPAEALPRPRPTLAFWCAWAFTALLFVRPQDTIRVLGPLHLPEVSAVAGLLALCVGRLTGGQPLIRMTREVVGVLGLGVVMLATAPFSVWPGGVLKTFLDVYLKVALIFILLTHSVGSLHLLRRVTWIMVLAMAYVALRGIFDYGRGVNVEDGRLVGPVAGLMGNPNDFAMNMVTFLPFALVTAFGRESTLRRSIGAVTSVAMLGVIVLTKSRAGMLGLAAMMVILILQAGRLRSSLMVALVLGSLLAIPAAPPNVWTRLSSIVNQDNDETGSREARKELMREGWLTFLRFPLTGVGAGQFQNYNPPDRTVMWHETHNVLLQVLAELGVAGGACFVFLMGCMVTALARTKRWLRRPAIVDAFGPRDLDRLRMHVMAGTAGFAGWFVCAQFASIGYYWTFYYLLAFVVIARDVTRARLRRVDLRVG